MAHSKDYLDSKFKDLKAATGQEETNTVYQTLTLWIPIETKNKYEHLQGLTNKKFGKSLKEIVIESIAHAETELAI